MWRQYFHSLINLTNICSISVSCKARSSTENRVVNKIDKIANFQELILEMRLNTYKIIIIIMNTIFINNSCEILVPLLNYKNIKIIKTRWAWWFTPVILALWEVGGSPEVGTSRPAWLTR